MAKDGKALCHSCMRACIRIREYSDSASFIILEFTSVLP